MTRSLAILLVLVVCGTALVGCERRERRAQRAAVTKKDKNPPAANDEATAKAKSQPKPQPKPPAGPQPLWSTVITGIGNDEQQAVQQAVQQAQIQLTRFLAEQKPPVAWTVPAEYIHKKLQPTSERSQEKENTFREEWEKKGKKFTYECWDVAFTLTPAVYSDIVVENDKFLARKRQLERDERRGVRVTQEAKLVGVVLAMLLGVVGYIRLDQWTGGQCTRVLRVALLAFLVVAGLGLWWFR